MHNEIVNPAAPSGTWSVIDRASTLAQARSALRHRKHRLAVQGCRGAACCSGCGHQTALCIAVSVPHVNALTNAVISASVRAPSAGADGEAAACISMTEWPVAARLAAASEPVSDRKLECRRRAPAECHAGHDSKRAGCRCSTDAMLMSVASLSMAKAASADARGRGNML